MEICVQALDGQEIPNDAFVGLRIGDVHKQSRLASGPRTYHFPDPGPDRREFGRVEVYKRVGTAVVSLSDVQDNEDVCVHCKDGSMKEVRLQIEVADGAKGSKAAKRELDSKGRKSKAVSDAQRYVAEHNLEEIVADAMREVLRTRPENPTLELAEFILRRGLNANAEPKAGEDGVGRTSRGVDNLDVAGTKNAEQPAKEPAFADAQGSLQKKASPAAPLGPSMRDATPFRKLPSVGSWLAAPPEELPLEPLSFPKKPSVGTWLSAVPGLGPDCEALVPAEPFRHKPSVGSWLAPIPKDVERPWFYQKDAPVSKEYIEKLQAFVRTQEVELDRQRRVAWPVAIDTAQDGTLQLFLRNLQGH
eukprot:CAMPEP_0178452654 /NCGR_PEP_ID=MMETSP0689_2-20121128/44363_1 /TAXON_ID=160604 /ORGANISM="Amphidinium massartii, Strain CS-259" /LENGTH=360 /DNA_ID=CAMNT_0020078381 /DNA_START=65 /DNA_END=1148 /DNA_ORIENTATION=-